MGKVDKTKLARDIAIGRRLGAHTTPGLPLDGDVPEARTPMPTMPGLMDRLLEELLIEKSPFFDQVCEQWETLFPELVAKPERWQDGKLFLRVRTSGQLFSLRPKLPKIKKTLATLPTAPKRFAVHLEIR